MVFYFCECLTAQSFRRANTIIAKNLKIAKMIASKKQVYQNTVLIIGVHVDENGFILEPITKKIDGKWQYV